MSDTVKMQRGEKFADVHPKEVSNYSEFGWEATEPQESAPVALFSAHKVVDGKPAKRGSKYNLTQAEADQFIADNPDDVYEIRPDNG